MSHALMQFYYTPLLIHHLPTELLYRHFPGRKSKSLFGVKCHTLESIVPLSVLFGPPVLISQRAEGSLEMALRRYDDIEWAS